MLISQHFWHRVTFEFVILMLHLIAHVCCVSAVALAHNCLDSDRTFACI